MARYLYCEPCGSRPGMSKDSRRGSGEDAERIVWGVVRAPQMKTGSYAKGATGTEVVGRVGRRRVVNETVTINETTTVQAAPHADMECAACGADIVPGERACAYTVGPEPEWESRYLERADG